MNENKSVKEKEPHIVVENLTMAYGDFVVQRGLTFTIGRGDVFIVMGDSGCGKSTLLRHMVGLKAPAGGRVLHNGIDFWNSSENEQERMIRKLGVLYQSGALWSSMTLAENTSLPLREYTNLEESEISNIVSFKLSLVGLAGFENYYPSELSGGMRKRAALARAMALDPEILFLDEPSAGLDPINARLLDDLILEINDSLGTTFVVVSHELASIFAIGSDSVFLDAERKTMTASGAPRRILEKSDDEKIRRFLTRGSRANTDGSV